MKRGFAVIGANWGDEGKGLFVDALAHKAGEDGLVVRYNGGANAGHTVVTPEGKRMVFHHFGSGTFAGTPTYLSRFFVTNPLLFFKDSTAIDGFGITPEILVDPEAIVTTPFDMIINEVVEEWRTQRHGSCGVGLGEAIERSLSPRYHITVADLDDPDYLVRVLKDIRNCWVPRRLARLGIDDTVVLPDYASVLDNDGLIDNFMITCEQFRKAVTVRRVNDAGTVIFEGAQGLLLDEHHRWFPHVTRSKTGLHNIVYLAHQFGLDTLDVTYATRAYATRHGAGPMPYETTVLPYPAIKDDTNLPHAFQGTLRFGWLDTDLLRQSIADDLKDAGDISVHPQLGITCLDQVGDTVNYVKDGKLQFNDVTTFLDTTFKLVGSTGLHSWGPTRNTIRNFQA